MSVLNWRFFLCMGCILQMLCKWKWVSNISIYICVCSEDRSKMTKSYLRMCAYVRVCTLENYIVTFCGVCVCPLTECVSMYAWGDVEVHQKLSSLNYSKHAKVVRINLFSLAVRSQIFSCVSEAVCGESLWLESEWEQKKRKERKKTLEEVVFESVEYIGF